MTRAGSGCSRPTTSGAPPQDYGSLPVSDACFSAERNRPSTHNGFFWVKLAMFGVVLALELTPMITFVRVRSARRRGALLPRFSVEVYRRINAAEVVLVDAIVFVAAFMARGAWLF